MEGWIKLHRKFIKWEWISEPNMISVYINLLLRASHNNYKWKGIEIKKGQLPFGRKKFSDEIKLSEQSVRTCIKRLKSTSEITIDTSNQGSIISITNWDSYQLTNQQPNQQPTSDQPASNQQVTTTKNEENINNEENEKDKKENTVIINNLISHWNSQPCVKKSSLGHEINIQQKLAMIYFSEDEIFDSIKNYNKVLECDQCFKGHKKNPYLLSFLDSEKIEKYININFNIEDFYDEDYVNPNPLGDWCTK